MITLYFLRHGQTDFNRKGIVQGSGVDSDLNEFGKEQAKAFFTHYRRVPFEHLFASKLKRTHQTLHPWIESGKTFSIHAGLNELNWGVHEGIKPSPAHRENFQSTLQKWAQGHLHEKVKQGESPVEAWSRAEGFFSQLKKDFFNHNILLCSHGRQLRIILSSLIDQDLKQMEKYAHSNTGLSIVTIDRDGRAHPEQINDTRHL